MAEHERAQRAAAAARLWGADGVPEGLASGGAALVGGARPPAQAPPLPPSPLAGLSPEARAAAVADRLARLGAAVGALVVSAWAIGGAAAARCADEKPAVRGLLPPPAGSVCESLPQDAKAAQPPPSFSGPLWRRLAWAAGALRGGNNRQASS